jgi:hypothetical protein
MHAYRKDTVFWAAPLLMGAAGTADVAVFWQSDPVGPGETVLLMAYVSPRAKADAIRSIS